MPARSLAFALSLLLPAILMADDPQPAASQPAKPASGPDAFEVRETKFTGGDYDAETFRYLLLTPQKIEAGKKYPLVLFLHGAGERGNDPQLLKKHFLAQIGSAENRERFPCFVVVPQCRNGVWWAGRPPANRNQSDATADDMGEMMKMALQCVAETIETQPVDESRLYLTGISMGGFGSWDLAARQPKRWAAVVPICGGGDEANAEKLTEVPLWVVHGDADPAVPVDRSRRMVAAIRAAGGHPAYTESPGVGHESWTPAYKDLGVVAWMFANKNVEE